MGLLCLALFLVSNTFSPPPRAECSYQGPPVFVALTAFRAVSSTQHDQGLIQYFAYTYASNHNLDSKGHRVIYNPTAQHRIMFFQGPGI